jgi:hypothetical protein
MAHSFSMTIPGDLSDALRRVEKQIVSPGGSFRGTTASGTFSGETALGPVEGTYTASGSIVTVTLTRKPPLVPDRIIESAIRAYFAA